MVGNIRYEYIVDVIGDVGDKLIIYFVGYICIKLIIDFVSDVIHNGIVNACITEGRYIIEVSNAVGNVNSGINGNRVIDVDRNSIIQINGDRIINMNGNRCIDFQRKSIINTNGGVNSYGDSGINMNIYGIVQMKGNGIIYIDGLIDNNGGRKG